jgi:hypothetical protein
MSTKSKFSLTPNPTFSAIVSIPVPGGLPYPVTFTFKGRTREDFNEFIKGLPGREDMDILMDIVSGWELEDVFDKAHVQELHDGYLGAARAIIDKYLAELTNGRLGN